MEIERLRAQFADFDIVCLDGKRPVSWYPLLGTSAFFREQRQYPGTDPHAPLVLETHTLEDLDAVMPLLLQSGPIPGPIRSYSFTALALADRFMLDQALERVRIPLSDVVPLLRDYEEMGLELPFIHEVVMACLSRGRWTSFLKAFGPEDLSFFLSFQWKPHNLPLTTIIRCELLSIVERPTALNTTRSFKNFHLNNQILDALLPLSSDELDGYGLQNPLILYRDYCLQHDPSWIHSRMWTGTTSVEQAFHRSYEEGELLIPDLLYLLRKVGEQHLTVISPSLAEVIWLERKRASPARFWHHPLEAVTRCSNGDDIIINATFEPRPDQGLRMALREGDPCTLEVYGSTVNVSFCDWDTLYTPEQYQHMQLMTALVDRDLEKSMKLLKAGACTPETLSELLSANQELLNWPALAEELHYDHYYGKEFLEQLPQPLLDVFAVALRGSADEDTLWRLRHAHPICPLGWKCFGLAARHYQQSIHPCILERLHEDHDAKKCGLHVIHEGHGRRSPLLSLFPPPLIAYDKYALHKTSEDVDSIETLVEQALPFLRYTGDSNRKVLMKCLLPFHENEELTQIAAEAAKQSFEEWSANTFEWRFTARVHPEHPEIHLVTFVEGPMTNKVYVFKRAGQPEFWMLVGMPRSITPLIIDETMCARTVERPRRRFFDPDL